MSWRRRMKTNVENSKKMGKHLEMFCVVVVEPRSIQVKVEQETNETRQEKKTKKSASVFEFLKILQKKNRPATLHWKSVYGDTEIAHTRKHLSTLKY